MVFSKESFRREPTNVHEVTETPLSVEGERSETKEVVEIINGQERRRRKGQLEILKLVMRPPLYQKRGNREKKTR